MEPDIFVPGRDLACFYNESLLFLIFTVVQIDANHQAHHNYQGKETTYHVCKSVCAHCFSRCRIKSCAQYIK